jgi:hypothetical protein
LAGIEEDARMQRRLDQWTTALSALLIVGALLACKKKTPEAVPSAEPVAATPAPTPPAVTAPAAPTTPPADAAAPKLGDVKRYPDKEKAQTGAVRILENDVKVFNEADDKTSDVASLDKDLLVFRLASLPDWELVEFPSGVGKVSPGWVLAKFVDAKADAKVEREAVASQAKQAVVKAPTTSTSAKPATSAAASAKPAASTATSAKPATSASVKPAASATTTAKPATSTAPAPAPTTTTTAKKTSSKTAAPATGK